MTATLDVTGLRKQYPGSAAAAIAGLDLTVSSGSCVALLGPSGSGKTTALRLIAGLDAPDGGDVRVGGVSVLQLPPERRGMAMVSQRPLLFPHLTVLDNVAFAARMAGASRRAARSAASRYLELVQLGALAQRRPATLSGGQAQRVALARGLAAEPSVLLLDEPFSALDPSLRTDMHQLVMEVRAILEPTILLVTHDQQEATALADSIAIVVEGHLLQHAGQQELFGGPASLEVYRFLGGLNEIPGVLVGAGHRSALGVLPTPQPGGVPEGPAVLTVRQESVGVVAADDKDADVVGVVARVTPRGPRTLLEVTTKAGPLFAELPVGHGVGLGTVVGLALPMSARLVVPKSGGRRRDRVAAAQIIDASPSRETQVLAGADRASEHSSIRDRS